MPLSSTDQLGRVVQFNFPPQRIISLVPSQTEFLFDIGLNNEIAGVTRFCIHPAALVKDKPKIGGTKRFDIEKIKQLQPDLIIGNKEENYEEGIDELQQHFPVWMSDIFTLHHACQMMLELGRITNRQQQATEVVKNIEQNFAAYNLAQTQAPTCAYFIWRKPYMVAAGNTFISQMIKAFGMQNVFENQSRYPEINIALLHELNLDYIFLSSEPYSFTEKHFDEFQSLAPKAKVVLVDGEMFSWYGSRLRFTAAYFTKLREQLGL